VRANGASTGSDIALAMVEVEASVAELLHAYKRALKFAANMPLLGRCKVFGGWRWGSRFFTKLYVEVHVRRELQTIRSCLTMELLGTTEAEERQRIVAPDAELAERVRPLLRWRRVAGLLTRLPPVAAVLPIVSAASVWPVDGDISARAVIDSLIVLGATGLTLWLLVVWSSVRLGFRTKRAILTGGRDLRHPLLHDPGELRWRGFFPVSKVDDDVGHESVDILSGKFWAELLRVVTGRKRTRRKFPRTNVYKLENHVFELLGRRKPKEVPLDMLFGFTLYLWFAFSALVVAALVDVGASGFDVDPRFWLFLPALLLLPVLPFQVVLQMIWNYRQRPH
jgi:hypothetical protein